MSGASKKRPHAVSNVATLGGFSYDDNGNQVSGARRSISWNSFDMPVTISKDSDTNGPFVNSGHLKFKSGLNRDDIFIEGFVDDQRTGQGEQVVKAINKGLTGSYVNKDGRIQSITTQLVLAKTDDEKKAAMLILKPCPTSMCPIISPTEFVAAKGQIAGNIMYLTNRAIKADYVHEFGHNLGMQHWHNGIDSIMAYDKDSKVRRHDISRLFEM
ncbi:hypothetical protein [Undibacterium flavidum]|uniref:Dual-action HEIGH metallo-peptidase n=1 Tax=Undibacterium flavidum TaxID=2762297 RepID=A0ABR6YFR9_9BURK|nr:hypothetical protein [Undibacterium flavidum]MBC3875415.1 hypothetical protein [Undibacterium flavidum]